ncbi:MAG TPA: glycogen debranching enzyme N-terminal domain-containing protein, partial [Vicinamibacterales bacterium]
MNDLIRTIDHPRDREQEAAAAGERPPRREWLVTNGLGGYASGTVAGVMTRRYHGLLIAALPAPLGRIVMFNHLLERVRFPDRRFVWLGDEDEVAGQNAIDRRGHLVEFRLELGLPVWVYEVGGFVIEKRVLMPHGQNTVHVAYRVIEGDGTLRFALRPSVQFRPHESAVDESPVKTYTLSAAENRYELTTGTVLPPLRLMLHGERAALTLDAKDSSSVPYKMEEMRGYQWIGSLWSPGYFRADA